MRVGLLVLQDLGVLNDRSAAVEDTGLDVRHVLAESIVLVADLESELASVAHNQDGALASDGLDLLEGGEDEDCGLTQAGFGLADNITTKHGLGNACLLNCIRGSQVRMGHGKTERNETEDEVSRRERPIHRRSKPVYPNEEKETTPGAHPPCTWLEARHDGNRIAGHAGRATMSGHRAPYSSTRIQQRNQVREKMLGNQHQVSWRVVLDTCA